VTGVPAIVLLSGGLDSATVAAMARADGFDVYALSFRYGQRHAVELSAASRVAAFVGAVEHRIVDIDLRAFGGSALTDDIEVPKGRPAESMAAEIPVTYVPARNTIFLSFALAYAEVRDAADVFIGVNAVDYSGYPDCRPEYLAAFQDMARLATRAAVSEGQALMLRAPLIAMTKAEIIQAGTALGVDYSVTVSCYDPNDAGEACGACDSCVLRRKGFADAGLDDPTRYR
jgi:7-cyano-7-deazaguanine synthase